MLNKPIDEMSLRQLFSTDYSSNILKIQYWGPVLNHLGEIEQSPDCLVLDKRKNPFVFRKCEFKFIPEGASRFKDNGYFDIAIIWDLPQNLTRENLLQQLRQQNKCQEVLVLNEMRDFRRLPAYSIPDKINFFLIEKLRDYLVSREPDIIYSAYLIAKSYPIKIDSLKLANLVANNFQRIKEMKPQGRVNAIIGSTQMQPAPIEFKHGNNYCWNDDFDPVESVNMMEELFRNNFQIEIPNRDLVEIIR